LDIDGDSLVYQLVNPLNDAGGNIAFSGSYSATNPMPTSGGFNFNTQTGQMSFTPTQQGVYVIDVLVSEYRNGQLIGTTMRDIQIVVINCTNNPPNINSCLTLQNVSGAVVNSCNSLGVCPGQNVSFTIGAKDPDGQKLTVTSNIANSIPGASLTTTYFGTNQDSAKIVFNWTPLGTDTGFRYFTIQVKDSACPIPGIQIFTYQITVLQGTEAGPDLYYCTGGGPENINAHGGNTFSWTPTAYIVSASGPDSATISVAPATNTTYVVTSDLMGGCKNKDTVNVFNVNTFSTTTSTTDDTICLNAGSSVTVTPSDPNQGPYTYNWGPLTQGVQSPNAQTTIVRPYNTTMYQVTVISASGCTIHDSIQVAVNGVAPKITVTPSANYVCPGDAITLTPLVRAVQCGAVADPNDPCVPGSSFSLKDIGTATTSATGSTTPYIGFWDDGRVQYLYRASELQAMGLTSGAITDIAFNVITKNSTQPYNNFTIKMACTSLNQLPTTFVTSGFTTVVNPVTYTTQTGWNTHTLDVPYNWDGFTNIIIEICFDNSTYTGYDAVAYTPTTFTGSVLWDDADLATSSGCTALTSPVIGQNRPNTRFIMCLAPLSNYTFTWTGSDGSTLPSVPNPTVTLNHDVNYTVVIDDGNCQGDTTLSLFVDTAVLISAGNDTAICGTDSAQLHLQLLHPTTLTCVANYTQSSVPYALITPQGTVTNVTAFSAVGGFTAADEGTSIAIPMSFPFQFYCQAITKFYISTNGYISFSPITYTSFTPVAIPGTGNPNNYIAPFWHDFDLASGGRVSYFTNGTAPNRIMCVNFDSIAFYGGTGFASGQIQLYENGRVEIHQTSFTDEVYVTGIENIGGTSGSAVSGSNNQFVTFNGPRAFRFSPVYLGNSLITVQWAPSTGLSSDTATNPMVLPNGTTTYVATATFINGCVTTDTVTVSIGTFPYSVGLTNDSICYGDSTQLLFNGTGSAYLWSPAAGLSSDTVQNPFASPAATTTYHVTAYSPIGCRVDDTVRVIVRDHTPITLGGNVSLCPYDSVTLSPSGGPYLSYSWSTGATTPSITTAQQTALTQDYWVRVNDGICFYNSDTATVTEFSLAPIVVQPSGDTALCIGETITLSADAGYVTYNWSNGAGTQQITVSTAGDYSYTATDGNGCTLVALDTAHVQIVPKPAANILTDRDSICEGQSVATLHVTPETDIVYTWNPGGVVNDTFVVITAGTYTVHADHNGCASDDAITIYSTQPPVVDLGADISVCACDTVITLSGNLTGAYQWSNGDSTQTINIHNITTSTNVYTVTVTNNNGCTATDNIVVDVYCLTVDAVVSDPPTATVYIGRNAVLDVASTSYNSNFDYFWTPSTYLDDSTKKSPHIEAPQVTTTYVVMVTDQLHGCIATDTVTLAVIPQGVIPIPNAFTPNGDGHNDLFGPAIPAGQESLWTIVSMRIYDRWGQTVYNSNSYWDGSFAGTMQPAGTYIYYIVMTGPDQNDPSQTIQYTFSGSFTLLH